MSDASLCIEVVGQDPCYANKYVAVPNIYYRLTNGRIEGIIRTESPASLGQHRLHINNSTGEHTTFDFWLEN